MTSERRPRRGTQANVEIVENPRVQSLSRRRRASREAFLARHEGRKDETRETDPATGITTEHNRPGTMIIYKPTETQGYVTRRVSVSSLRLLLDQGWSEFCPDCGGEHLDRHGKPTTDPNACKVRPPVMFTVCPICRHPDDPSWRKYIFDNHNLANPDSGEVEQDANFIRFETETTPEQRLKTLYEFHMWCLHPRQAQMRHIAPLPTALAEIAESRQASIS